MTLRQGMVIDDQLTYDPADGLVKIVHRSVSPGRSFTSVDAGGIPLEEFKKQFPDRLEQVRNLPKDEDDEAQRTASAAGGHEVHYLGEGRYTVNVLGGDPVHQTPLTRPDAVTLWRQLTKLDTLPEIIDDTDGEYDETAHNASFVQPFVLDPGVRVASSNASDTDSLTRQHAPNPAEIGPDPAHSLTGQIAQPGERERLRVVHKGGGRYQVLSHNDEPIHDGFLSKADAEKLAKDKSDTVEEGGASVVAGSDAPRP